jgi:hypothetical protein
MYFSLSVLHFIFEEYEIFHHASDWNILWLIDPLLGRDLEVQPLLCSRRIKQKTPVSKQRSVNTFPRKRYPMYRKAAAMVAIEGLGEAVISVGSAPRLYNKDTSKAASQLSTV